MTSCRLLCVLLFPILAVMAADDLDDEYMSQSKTIDTIPLPPPIDSPSQSLAIPRMLAAIIERLELESAYNQESVEPQPIRKRVFCNGFTGCGGRFRGRRRQQHPLRKRPFCNWGGCTGVKRTKVPSKAIAQKVMRLPEAFRKRLFCNGFDGCRGGKRALYSNWLSKLQGIADDL